MIPPLLKAHIDATLEMAIANTSRAISERNGNIGELTFHQSNTSKSDFPISVSSSRHLTNSDFELSHPFSDLCFCNSLKKISKFSYRS